MCANDPVVKEPPLFPLFLDLRGRLAVVVGAGRVARRKVRALLSAGARVRVVAPDALALREVLKEEDRCPWESLELAEQAYREGDLAGAQLVFACSDDAEVNALVAREAEAARIFVNVADSRELSSALVPAVLSRGPLISVAVSTRGASPRLSTLLRDSLAAAIGVEWEKSAELLDGLRRWWEPLAKEAGLSQAQRQEVWENLVNREFVLGFSEQDMETVSARARRLLSSSLFSGVSE